MTEDTTAASEGAPTDALEGAMRALDPGKSPAYLVYSGGTWIQKSCGPGTVAYPHPTQPGAIYCGFPQEPPPDDEP